jgi:hypothetical protein
VCSYILVASASDLGTYRRLIFEGIENSLYLEYHFLGGWQNIFGKTDILRLSVSEWIRLVQDIGDRIAEVPDSIFFDGCAESRARTTPRCLSPGPEYRFPMVCWAQEILRLA